MSSNIELALLTRVIDEQNFHALEKAQITEDYFVTPEAKEVYRFLRHTYHDPQTIGLVPSRDMVRYRFPTFYFAPQVSDQVLVLCAQMRIEKIRMESMRVAQELQSLAERDPQAAVALLRSESANISRLSEVGQDLSMASAFNLLWDQYQITSESQGMLGIPYPWHQLNDETQGMQGSQFIVLYGRPKSMKTWIAIYMAVHNYLFSRRRVLFYTREMNPKLVAQRVAATIAGVDYKAFKNGTLQPELRDRVFTILNQLKEDEQEAGRLGLRQPYFIIISDRGAGGGGGVGWLQSKIREMQPDIVYVDGMYLMKDDRSNQRSVDWKQIAHISQDLKLTSQEFDVPLVGVTQANRAAQKTKGDDLTELAFSDALGQDADAVFRVSKEQRVDEQGVKHTELFLRAPGLREGVFDGIVLHAQPATNFGYIRTLTAEDNSAEGQNDYGEGGRRRQNGAAGGGIQPRPTFGASGQARPYMDPRGINTGRR